ncbi:MAG TPA: isoprenyl transferase [Eubacteriaceae bacterium]|nr:isoprenyl transferase [Eubacteriaceae bacterium]
MSTVSFSVVPNHVAIIMDGNGRWAKERNRPRIFGHRAGVQAIREVVTCCGKYGVKALTLYAFSTENWKRPKTEVEGLMKLFDEYLKKEVSKLHENNVVLRVIGDRSRLAPSLVERIEESERQTKDNTGLILNLAVNYGGRDEIIRGIKTIGEKISSGELNPDQIDGTVFSQYLYTKDLPDPDLIIRTSGELRLSNFLIWQAAYAELWFTDVLWPDFREENLLESFASFEKRKRRFGGIK